MTIHSVYESQKSQSPTGSYTQEKTWKATKQILYPDNSWNFRIYKFQTLENSWKFEISPVDIKKHQIYAILQGFGAFCY